MYFVDEKKLHRVDRKEITRKVVKKLIDMGATTEDAGCIVTVRFRGMRVELVKSFLARYVGVPLFDVSWPYYSVSFSNSCESFCFEKTDRQQDFCDVVSSFIDQLRVPIFRGHKVYDEDFLREVREYLSKANRRAEEDPSSREKQKILEGLRNVYWDELCRFKRLAKQKNRPMQRHYEELMKVKAKLPYSAKIAVERGVSLKKITDRYFQAEVMYRGNQIREWGSSANNAVRQLERRMSLIDKTESALVC